MGFKKGHKKVGGSTKGTKQKRTIEWEAFGRELLENGLPRALEIMQTCGDDKFIAHFEKFLEYFKPKLQRTELTGEVNMKTISETTIFKVKAKT